MSEDKYVRIQQVVERTGLSRPTIYGMVKAGIFPNKIALGARAVAWLESEIIQWMEARKSFEKTGREAKPGRPPTASGKKKTPASAAAKTPVSIDAKPEPEVQVAPPKEVIVADDWGQNDPPLSDADMEAVRFARLVARQPGKSAGTPVKKGIKPVDISLSTAPKRKVVVVSSRDIFALRSADKKK